VASIESLISGSEKITQVFGYWPTFHDAEVLDLHFWRGHVDADKGVYDFPVLTLRIHLWELTKEVNSEGYLVLKHHTLTTLRFSDVHDFEMRDFNHQNAIMELSLSSHERTKPPSPYFAVQVIPAFGISASFNCIRIEVVDAVPCTEAGVAVP
jgi:hypothetical protein